MSTPNGDVRTPSLARPQARMLIPKMAASAKHPTLTQEDQQVGAQAGLGYYMLPAAFNSELASGGGFQLGGGIDFWL